ncbi:MAG: hypothetical protein KDK55_06370, partial [Chlamydiia bacterium]|nr:hypothetical protein [Chlamydiia bacterium]
MNKSLPLFKEARNKVETFTQKHPLISKVLGVIMMAIGLIFMLGAAVLPFALGGPGSVVLAMLIAMGGLTIYLTG